MLEIIITLIAIFLIANFITNLIARITDNKYWRQVGMDLTNYSYLCIGEPEAHKIWIVIEWIAASILYFWGHFIRLQFWYLARFK